MDDLQFGTRNKRGDWAPTAHLELPPFWRRPFSLPKVIWPGFRNTCSPWNAFHMATALVWWFFVVPRCGHDADLVVDLGAVALRGERHRDLRLLRLGRALLVCPPQAGHPLQVQRQVPVDQPSDVFWFKSQNIDNFLRSFFVSIPLWTLVEVLFLWAFANSWAVWLPWETHWPWLVVLALISPAIHEVHFFCIHRLIHVPILYKWIHSVHHNSVNPSPWSSLSMHPVEGFLYHAVAFWHLIIPSNPLLAMYQLHLAGFGAVNGHIGFDKLETDRRPTLDSHAYAHYLHHKYFEVNYGGDGLIPLDRGSATGTTARKKARRG